MTQRRGNKRLHEWLTEYLDNGAIKGVQWLNKSLKTFRIPWVHQSRKACHKTSNEVCIQWETYRGRKSTNVKKAKATFRMAINSAKRKGLIIEVQKMSKDAWDPCIIYKFTLPKKRPSGNSVSSVNSESSVSSEDSFDEEQTSPNREIDDDSAIPTTVAEAAKHRAVIGQLNTRKRTGNRKKNVKKRRSSTPSSIGQTANQSDVEDNQPHDMDYFSSSSSIDNHVASTENAYYYDNLAETDLAEIGYMDLTFADEAYIISLTCEAVLRGDPEVNHY